MKHLVKLTTFITLVVTVLFVSCKKENTSNQLSTFYKLTINGASKKIDACGSSSFVAEYLRDTAVFVGFGCGGQGAGFYLKGQIVDGTYLLDNKNTAWYYESGITYTTDRVNIGVLVLKNRNFQGQGGNIPYIEGTVFFDAVDKQTGQKIKVSQGTYSLKKYQY